MFVRSINHSNSFSNPGKKKIICEFLDLYFSAAQDYINLIWNQKFYDDKNELIWDINSDKLNLPKFLDYKLLSHPKLSARALSSALEQAIGIVKGRVAIRKKLLYVIQKQTEECKSTDYWIKKLDKHPLAKPILKEDFKAQLSQKLIEIRESKGFFNLFIKLSSTGFRVIKIPIKLTKLDKKMDL